MRTYGIYAVAAAILVVGLALTGVPITAVVPLIHHRHEASDDRKPTKQP